MTYTFDSSDTIGVSLYNDPAGNGNAAANPYQQAARIARAMDWMLYRPANVQQMLDWAEYLSRQYGGIVADIRKAVSYFLTEVRFEATPGGNISPEDLDVYNTYVNTPSFKAMVVEYAVNLCLFGTQVITAQNETVRDLVCESCGSSTLLSELLDLDLVTLDSGDFKFRGHCLHNGCATGPNSRFKISDRYDTTVPPKFISQDLRSISLSYNPVSGSYTAAMYPDKILNLRRGLSNQSRAFLLDTPVEILQALAESKELIFDNEASCHIDTIKPPTHRSADFAGWGMPLFFSSFNNVMMLLLIDAFNRKIIIERVLPTELISPAIANRGAMSVDLISDIVNPDQFETKMKSIFGSSHSGILDANRMFTMPWPITHQVLGGDAKSLVAIDLMQEHRERILDDMGIPPEIRNSGGAGIAKGSIGGGLPFFVQSWSYVSAKMNNFVNWAANRIGTTLNLPSCIAKLEDPVLQQDPQRLQFMMQEAQIGNLPPGMLYAAMGFRYRECVKNAAQDAKWREDLLKKRQQKQQEQDENSAVMAATSPGAQIMQQQQGGGAPGGMPPAPGAPNMSMGPAVGGGDPVQQFLQQTGFNPAEKNPANMDKMAQQIATNIVQMQDKGMVQKIYAQLQASNRIMYTLVKDYAEKMRSQAASEGKQALSAPQ